MKRGRHAIILFILLVIFLLACQTGDKPDIQPQPVKSTDVKLVKAVASDSIDTAVMTKLREFSTDVDMDGIEENIELYTAAGRDEQGEMLWDDGQDWLLTVRDGEKSYTLLQRFVQLGVVHFTVSYGGDEQIPNITVMVPTDSSFIIMRYAFDKDKEGFMEEEAYESKDDFWIYSSIPGY